MRLSCIRTSRAVTYLLALTLPFQVYIELGAFPLSTSYVLIGATAALWVLALLARGRCICFVPRQTWWMLMFLALIAVNSAFAADPRASIILGIQIVAYFALFFLTANLLDTTLRIRRVVNLLLIGAMASSAVGVAQAAIGSVAPDLVVDVFYRSPVGRAFIGSRGLERVGDIGRSGPYFLDRGANIESVGSMLRAFGTFEGPTVYGWFTVTLAILALGLWRGSAGPTSTSSRVAGWVAWVCGAAVFLSWTRSAWLALVLGVAFVLAFCRARSIGLLSTHWWAFGGVALLVIGLTLAAGLLLQDTPVGQVIISMVGGEDVSGSNAGRIQTMRYAWGQLGGHLVSGVGLGNYPYVASGGLVDSSVGTFYTAHNTYLELGVELGLPGLLTFIWLLLALLVRALRLIEQPVGTYWHALGLALAGVWISLLLTLMFGGNIVHPRWMTTLWLLGGIQAASSRVLKRGAASPRTPDGSAREAGCEITVTTPLR